MVQNSGTPARAPHLRSLNQPRALRVVIDHGVPVALIEGVRRLAVVQIQDVWTIEDEWWRQPINRRYFCLLLDGGIIRTVFHDRTTDTWYAQGY